MTAVIRVSVSVTIVSLKTGILGSILPLPCGAHVQGAKADETNIAAVTSMSVCQNKMTWLSNRVYSLNLLGDEKGGERRLITVLHQYTTRAICSLRRNGPFASSEDETNDEKAGKLLASRIAT